MTLKDRVAQLEAENAQLRQQVVQLTDALVKAYEALTPATPSVVTTPYSPQPSFPWPQYPNTPYVCQGIADSDAAQAQVTYNAPQVTYNAPRIKDALKDALDRQRAASVLS